jgi:hypothetical protein
MHIGLIGGIGPVAMDFYYRRLISTFASNKAALELTIVHADTPTLLSNLASNDRSAQVAIYGAVPHSDDFVDDTFHGKFGNGPVASDDAGRLPAADPSQLYVI